MEATVYTPPQAIGSDPDNKSHAFPTSATMSLPGLSTPPAMHPSSVALAPVNQTHSGGVRTNTVGSVLLNDVAIVSLVIDGQERLCLAQISNTLLRAYSYNEIHNRRVALGITCVQCTPVQLEILRRAGAMPVSSRRCGMITRRESQRLVRSFLVDVAPPKLPPDFTFEIAHSCGWGCRGNFSPSRYNSSRAKCIRCAGCAMYLSPNKFIFHYHRTPEARFNQPDAANFNSWRRHIRLTDVNPSEELASAWEEVKAMFNGGSRKRFINTGKESMQAKRVKTGAHPQQTMGRRTATLEETPYQFPARTMPNKLLQPMKTLQPTNTHPAFTVQFPYGKTAAGLDIEDMKGHPLSLWANHRDTMYPNYDLLWAKHLGLSSRHISGRDYHHHPSTRSGHVHFGGVDSQDEEKQRHRSMSPEELPFNSQPETSHCSAFRQVTSSSIAQIDEDCRSCSGNESDVELTVDVDTIDIETKEEENNNRKRIELSSEQITMPSDMTTSDVQKELYTEKEDLRDQSADQHVKEHSPAIKQPELQNENLQQQQQQWRNLQKKDEPTMSPQPHQQRQNQEEQEINENAVSYTSAQEEDDESNTVHQSCDEKSPGQDSGEQTMHSCEEKGSAAITNTTKADYVPLAPFDWSSMTKEQLESELRCEIESRRKLEADCLLIKGSFEEQVHREKRYREEINKQLHIARANLCCELDQEKRVRMLLQQQLKEAHDAIHSFSCKMLVADRQCLRCSYRDALLPR